MRRQKENFSKAAQQRLDPNAVQRRASDPAASVWVTASAGTGKTKVLTDRVLRLLLNGASPDQILCLTFTRAAASVMTNRIRDEMASWATCDDDVLEGKLRHLTGSKPNHEMTLRARRMFAEFLDAHGGMKIQTIHSFSQSLLRRFPIESGIVPYFEVMDDQRASDLLREAQVAILKKIQKNPDSSLSKAVGVITPEIGEDDFVNLIGELTYRRGQLLGIFEKFGSIEETIDGVYKYLQVKNGETVKAMQEALCSDEGLNGKNPALDDLQQTATMLLHGTDAERKKGELVLEWLDHPEKRMALFDEYKAIFMTADGKIRKRLTTKATADVEDFMLSEAERLRDGLDALQAQNVAEGTASLLRMTDAILQHYRERKRALNLLDYDDLVYQANGLMSEENSSSWVLEKLPGQLKHILVDEAQDTNPDQWKLIAAIVQEFFSTASRLKNKDNTLFVVGDEKQCIFSFQRADPEEFSYRKNFFKKMVEAVGGTWREVDMEIAFRSSPAITEAVDAVFSNPDAADGLFHESETKPHRVKHNAYRRGQAGVVEVHPVIKQRESEPPQPWSLPLQMEAASDPSVELAEQIADKIKDWLESGETLESRKRPISPADIMILVRRRSAFVEHMVHALKKRDVPVAGADRMSLREQMVVMDLVALGEVLLFPKDDYKLACVLKSPLIGMTDQELEDLAVERSGDLFTALSQKAADPRAAKIYSAAWQYLEDLQNKCDGERPYEFYSSLLLTRCPGSEKSGLSALYGRLGFEAEDPLVEFMNALERFEKNNIPSLQGFIAWLNAGEAEVKRENNMNPESPRVHIMTVHGAKGLEAPIVILPDTTGIPSDNVKARPRFLWPEGNREVPLWVPHGDMENAVFKHERARVELERDREYRRLLYVALTRAADRLYVFGAQNSGKLSEKSWYSLIKKGLEEGLKDRIEHVPAANDNAEDMVLRFKAEQTSRPKPDHVRPLDKKKVVGIPVWARTAAPPSVSGEVARFRPSTYEGANDNQRTARSPLLEKPETYWIQLGSIVHELLELLPLLPEQERSDAARDYLAKPAWNLRPVDQARTFRQVMDILKDPEFGALFSEDSRAEVSISGFVEKDGQKEMLSAQIDRLVVQDNTVLIIDYKNSWHVAQDDSEVSFKYIVQMAAYRMAVQQIYPDKEVKCALLYTREAKLVHLADKVLDEALEKVHLKPYVAPSGQARPAG